MDRKFFDLSCDAESEVASHRKKIIFRRSTKPRQVANRPKSMT